MHAHVMQRLTTVTQIVHDEHAATFVHSKEFIWEPTIPAVSSCDITQTRVVPNKEIWGSPQAAFIWINLKCADKNANELLILKPLLNHRGMEWAITEGGDWRLQILPSS